MEVPAEVGPCDEEAQATLPSHAVPPGLVSALHGLGDRRREHLAAVGLDSSVVEWELHSKGGEWFTRCTLCKDTSRGPREWKAVKPPQGRVNYVVNKLERHVTLDAKHIQHLQSRNQVSQTRRLICFRCATIFFARH